MAIKLSESSKNVLVLLVACLAGLAVVETGLRMSGLRFDQFEPPRWLKSRIDPPMPGMPALRDPISDIALPQIATADIKLAPEQPELVIPPGKPPPPNRSDWKQPPLYRFDPITGVTGKPGAEGWWMAEGLAYVVINNEGFRDRNHAVAKEPSVFRIAVLADSFSEALQMPQERTFWSILEQRLQSCPVFAKRRVEVLNFGVSGYGTTQELLTYRKFARKYQPNIVLLTFFIGNDLRDNVRSLSEPFGPGFVSRPFYTISGNELVLDTRFRDVRKRWVRRYERLRIVKLVQMISAWFKYRSWRIIDARALISPPDAEYERAWNVTEKVLHRLNTEVNADGGRLIVATVSTSQQAEPDPVRREKGARESSIQDLFYSDKRLYRLSREAGFLMIPLAVAMSEIAERTKAYFHGFANTELGVGHWNARGHDVAGKILTRKICEASSAR